VKPYPLKFEPIYKYRIWAGRKIAEIFGRDLPDDSGYGESWEVSDLPNDVSRITNGPLAGRTLRDALQDYPQQLAGQTVFQPPFPLLIKFLDAGELLSVQVHPDAETCRRMGRGDPKTECWYVIDADPGAVIYKGLRKNVTKESLAEAVRTGDIERLLDKVEVKAGQCHFLPAGTTHAIGGGLLLAEIQTPSDTTYRLFDWNRLDEGGKPRQLHVDEALESIHFGVFAADLPVTTAGRLADCPYFKIDKGVQARGTELLFSPGSMKVLIFVSGRGAIVPAAGDAVEFKAGECTLVPAAFEGTVCFGADTEYLTVT
jgi:mannose-6-phosphate isomerase